MFNVELDIVMQSLENRESSTQRGMTGGLIDYIEELRGKDDQREREKASRQAWHQMVQRRGKIN